MQIVFHSENGAWQTIICPRRTQCSVGGIDISVVPNRSVNDCIHRLHRNLRLPSWDDSMLAQALMKSRMGISVSTRRARQDQMDAHSKVPMSIESGDYHITTSVSLMTTRWLQRQGQWFERQCIDNIASCSSMTLLSSLVRRHASERYSCRDHIVPEARRTTGG